MSSFFKRQPELFDTKKLEAKRLGIASQGSGSNLAAAGLAMMADKPLAPDEIDSVPDSWVELAPSRASLSSSIEAVNAESNSGGDNSVNKDSRLSPVSMQSPHVEFESSLEQVKYRLVRDMLPMSETAKSTDWLWDWSNRSDAGISTQKNGRNRSGPGQIGSTLTTPPNSPEPESSEFEFKSKTSGKSLRKKQPRSAFLRLDVLLGLVFSNLVTFFLGAAIGYCICRKMVSKGSNVEALEEMNTFYFC